MHKKPMDEATKKRVRAARLLQKGKLPAEIARQVGVARQTVYTWKALFDEGGIDALRAVRSRGRPGKLDEAQHEALRRAILQKPTEHGFGTDLWTLKRVGALIKRQYGVKYSQTQVWRILGALGFSPQRPDKRALERNDDAVQHWTRSTWPGLKKKPSEKEDGLSLSTNRASANALPVCALGRSKARLPSFSFISIGITSWPSLD